MQLLRPSIEAACHFMRLLPVKQTVLLEFGASPLPTQNAIPCRSLGLALSQHKGTLLSEFGPNFPTKKSKTHGIHSPHCSTNPRSQLSLTVCPAPTQFRIQGQTLRCKFSCISGCIVHIGMTCNAASLVVETLTVRMHFKRLMQCAAESQRPIFQHPSHFATPQDIQTELSQPTGRKVGGQRVAVRLTRSSPT